MNYFDKLFKMNENFLAEQTPAAPAAPAAQPAPQAATTASVKPKTKKGGLNKYDKANKKAIIELQTILRDMNFLPDNGIDGRYGIQTHNAVQQARGWAISNLTNFPTPAGADKNVIVNHIQALSGAKTLDELIFAFGKARKFLSGTGTAGQSQAAGPYFDTNNPDLYQSRVPKPMMNIPLRSGDMTMQPSFVSKGKLPSNITAPPRGTSGAAPFLGSPQPAPEQDYLNLNLPENKINDKVLLKMIFEHLEKIK